MTAQKVKDVSKKIPGLALTNGTRRSQTSEIMAPQVGLEAAVKRKRKYLKSSRRRQESTNGSVVHPNWLQIDAGSSTKLSLCFTV